MFVNHATGGCFERGGQGSRCLNYIIVDERLKRSFIAREEGEDQGKKARLPFAKILHSLRERRKVVLPPAHGGHWRMLTSAGEVRAVGRALDLDQALGAAADGADSFS